MSRALRLAALAALASCGSAPDAPEGAAASAEGRGTVWRAAESRGGAFTARVRPDPDPFPVNEPFELDLELERAGGEPLEGADVRVSAWMPDHGHGMLRRPETEDLGGGRYRVRGMLLHMKGSWQIFVDVAERGISERAELEVEL